MSAIDSAYVLDSFAMLAYLGGEMGMPKVKALLRESEQMQCQIYISLINLGEILYITEREQGLPMAQAVLARMEELPVVVLPASRVAVLEAAHIKAQYRIAYADAFTVGAAQALRATIITGDPEFREVEKLVKIEWLDTNSSIRPI